MMSEMRHRLECLAWRAAKRLPQARALHGDLAAARELLRVARGDLGQATVRFDRIAAREAQLQAKYADLRGAEALERLDPLRLKYADLRLAIKVARLVSHEGLASRHPRLSMALVALYTVVDCHDT